MFPEPNSEVLVTKISDIIICEELSPSGNSLDESDIGEYGRRLGVIVTEEDEEVSSLLRNCLLEPLPSSWIPCWDRLSTHWFYFNVTTRESSWTHPLEESHRRKVHDLLSSLKRAKQELRGNPEGASDEVSTESVFGKGPKMMNGARTLKPLPPRNLAPLKKVPSAAFAAPPSQPSLSSAGRSLIRQSSQDLTNRTESGSTMSFTERLAAKRATRTTFGQGPNLAAATRKVHFEENAPKEIQYSPEVSEDLKDNSESLDSSNEILNLVGDACSLEPISGTNCGGQEVEENTAGPESKESFLEDPLERFDELRKLKPVAGNVLDSEGVSAKFSPEKQAVPQDEEIPRDQEGGRALENQELAAKLGPHEPAVLRSEESFIKDQEERLKKLKEVLERNLEQEKEKLEHSFQAELRKMREESEDRLSQEKRTWNDWLEQEKIKVRRTCEDQWESEKAKLISEVEQREAELRESLSQKKKEIDEKWEKEKEELEENLHLLIRSERDAKKNMIKSELIKIEEEFRQLTLEKRANLQNEAEALEKKFQQEILERENWFKAETVRIQDEFQKKLTEEVLKKKDPGTASPTPCHCQDLQKKLELMQKDMELLKRRRELESDGDTRPSSGDSSRRIVFRKSQTRKAQSARSRAVPLKATRVTYVDTEDESESTWTEAESRFQKGSRMKHRSRSLTNLHAGKQSRDMEPLIRAQHLIGRHKSKDILGSKRYFGVDDLSMELLSDTATSGVSSSLGSGAWMTDHAHQSLEWDGVMRSIRKISGDLQDVWLAIGHRSANQYRPRSANHWASSSPFLDHVPTPPLNLSLHTSTAEKTRALRQWLQKTNPTVE